MASNNSSNNVNLNNDPQKIDPITALQEGIGTVLYYTRVGILLLLLLLTKTTTTAHSLYSDGLSLAMFEALRGLRDASTVEEDNDNNSLAIDSYSNSSKTNKETGRNNTSALHRQQDSELVQKLVDGVFEKSYAIDAMLDNNHTSANNVKTPPLYTNRTKLQQMDYIQELVNDNNLVIQELYDAVQETIQQRNSCRQFIIKNSDMILSPLQQQENDVDANNALTRVAATTGTYEKAI